MAGYWSSALHFADVGLGCDGVGGFHQILHLHLANLKSSIQKVQMAAFVKAELALHNKVRPVTSTQTYAFVSAEQLIREIKEGTQRKYCERLQ